MDQRPLALFFVCDACDCALNLVLLDINAPWRTHARYKGNNEWVDANLGAWLEFMNGNHEPLERLHAQDAAAGTNLCETIPLGFLCFLASAIQSQDGTPGLTVCWDCNFDKRRSCKRASGCHTDFTVVSASDHKYRR